MFETVGAMGLGAATFCAFGYFALRQALPVMPFLYANARIQARSKHLISDKQWDALVEASSLADLTGLLRGTDYAEALEKTKDVRDYHIAIEKTFAKNVEDLKEMTPDSVDPLFDAYLMFWEAKMLKTFYRKLLTGQELDEKLVFPVGRINRLRLSHLKEAKTLADMKVIMMGTEYKPVLDITYKTLEEFEASLDNFIFRYFVEKVKKTKVYNGDLVIDLLNLKFDIQNLLVLLKLEARDVPEDMRGKYLIKNNTELYVLTPKLIPAKDIRGFVEMCSDLHYYGPLKEALEKYEKDGSLSHFEHVLNKYFKGSVLKLERLYFQGPYPLFTFLIKKEIEMKNLMIISKGINSKMGPEKIRELVI
jgi:vacuolar-type H+-ATPase subunit C/Vma6